jgi:hypothetical protein
VVEATSLTRDPRRGDLVVEGVLTLPIHLLESPSHGYLTASAGRLAEREHADRPSAITQVEGVVGVPGAGDSFMEIGDGACERDRVPIEAVGVSENLTWGTGGRGCRARPFELGRFRILMRRAVVTSPVSRPHYARNLSSTGSCSCTAN